MIGVSQEAAKTYTGNNSSATYAIDFPRFNADEIIAFIISPTGVQTLLIRDTDYTLSNVTPSTKDASLALEQEATGRPWINSSSGFLATGYKLIIEYNPEARQEVNFGNAVRTIIPELFGKVLDQLTMSLKASHRVVKRTLQLPRVDAEAGISPELPSISGNSGKVIAAKTDGSGYEFGPTTQSIFDAQTAAQNSANASANSALQSANSATSATNAAAAAGASLTAAQNAQTASESAQAASESAQTASEAARDRSEEINDLNEYSTQLSVTFADSPINVTVGNANTLFIVDSTGGDVVFNLPALSSVPSGFKVGILKVADATNSIIVNPDGAETIGGNSQVTSSDLGVGIKPYPDTASNWVRSFFTAGYNAPLAAGAGASRYTIGAVEDVANSGQITLAALSSQQILKVQGDGGARTAANAPFSATPADGTEIILIGQSDSNPLTIESVDVVGGCILNGDCSLRQDTSLHLFYDNVRQRYFEINRRD